MRKILDVLKLEATYGSVLLLAALFALLLNNSPLAKGYQAILQTSFTLGFFKFSLHRSILFWINEGLMSIFFLLVGLELKREYCEGHLSKREDMLLPAVAALGGMLLPACLYVAINFHHPITIKGWAIPVATDIAFALGILSLFGRKVPLGLKLFLTALAIFDDLGAIVIIAIGHTHNLSAGSILLALMCLAILIGLNRCGVRDLFPYLGLGFVLWACVLQSGIHATIAGILWALIIPIDKNKKLSPLHALEDFLRPWVAYLVMPLFALANAGVSFAGLKWENLFHPVLVGIVLGLVIGKQIGVFLFSWILVKMKKASLPQATTWLQLYGVALLCGIGFTMSLFLGTLAFQNDSINYLIEVRLGVLLGSFISGCLGVFILHKALK